jgi:hypothetical protein
MVPYLRDPCDAWMGSLDVWHHPSHHFPLFLVYKLSFYNLDCINVTEINIIAMYSKLPNSKDLKAPLAAPLTIAIK